MTADAATPPDAPRRGPLTRLLAGAAIGMIRLYQGALSPLMGGHCRFHPTCSRYAEQAFRTRAPHVAAWLMIRRLLRCHPLGSSGYDPVPPAPSAHTCGSRTK